MKDSLSKKVYNSKFQHLKKKMERCHTSSITTNLKALEQKKEVTNKRSRRQEIIQTEINKIETTKNQ